MAGIQVAHNGRGRPVDHDLPLLPFIDFMLCLVAFLLVTAAWSQMARISADANVPGVDRENLAAPTGALHVDVTSNDFQLTWRRGESVLWSHAVPRRRVAHADGTPTYPELGREIVNAWEAGGVHRSGTDPVQDRAVLHTSNALEFDEVVAVMDALHAPKRHLETPDGSREIPVFAVSFAVD